MKKIGFIDHNIDNWHAANYPKLIRESPQKDKFEVALLWQEAPEDGAKSLDDYCAEHGIEAASSLEQVVDECDCICVLAPRTPERHEDLCRYALASGKPVYVDKTFAPSLEVARRIVDRAKSHNTPLMSSSALRFDSAMEEAAAKIAGDRVEFVTIRGGGEWGMYAIHQVEMLAALMGTGAQRVMQCGTDRSKLMVVDYGEGRRGAINLIPGHGFQFSVQFGEKGVYSSVSMTDFFPRFVNEMLLFLDSGSSSVPIEQTLEIAAILEAGTKALETPDKWMDVPR